MIYGFIVLMTLLLLAFMAAWVAVPALRQYLETPKQNLLENSELFLEKYLK